MRHNAYTSQKRNAEAYGFTELPAQAKHPKSILNSKAYSITSQELSGGMATRVKRWYVWKTMTHHTLNT